MHMYSNLLKLHLITLGSPYRYCIRINQPLIDLYKVLRCDNMKFGVMLSIILPEICSTTAGQKLTLIRNTLT